MLFRIEINGAFVTDWSRGSVNTSLSKAADTIRMSLSFDKPFNFRQDFPFEELDPFTVYVADRDNLNNAEVLISGYLDSLDVSSGADSFNISIAGRSSTMLNVVGAAVVEGFSIRNVSLVDVANRFVEGTGLSVEVRASAKGVERANEKIPKVKVQLGETIHSLLVRLARQRALFVTSDSRETVVIADAEGARRPGVFNEHFRVFSKSFSVDASERKSEYFVVGQNRKKGISLADLEEAQRSFGYARDEFLDTRRILIERADKRGGVQQYQRHAEWLMRKRAAESKKLIYDIEGLADLNGRLVRKGELWRCIDEELGVDDLLLITDVSYRIADSDLSAQVTFANPSGWGLDAPPRPKRPKRRSTRERLDPNLAFDLQQISALESLVEERAKSFSDLLKVDSPAATKDSPMNL